MSNMLKQIRKNKQDLTLSKYLKDSYENGFKKGSMEAVYAFVAQVKQLKHIKGMDEEMFAAIVKHLEMEDLI